MRYVRLTYDVADGTFQKWIKLVGDFVFNLETYLKSRYHRDELEYMDVVVSLTTNDDTVEQFNDVEYYSPMAKVSKIAEAHGFTFVCDKMSWGRRTICVIFPCQPRAHEMTYKFMEALVDQLGIKVELWTNNVTRDENGTKIVEVCIKEWDGDS